MKLAICILNLFVFLPIASNALIVRRHFAPNKVTSLDLKGNIGDVTIKGSKSGYTKVLAKKNRFNEYCRLRIQEIDGTLLTHLVREPTEEANKCSVKWEIHIPQNTNISISMETGNLEVSQILGEINYKLNLGDVKITKLNNQINGVLSKGDVKIDGTPTQANILVTEGDISLKAKKLNNSDSSISLSTKQGTAFVYLSRKANVNTVFYSKKGEFRSEFKKQGSIPVKLAFTSETGNLILKRLR